MFGRVGRFSNSQSCLIVVFPIILVFRAIVCNIQILTDVPFVFLQVTDIHLTEKRLTILRDFESLLSYVVPVIQPEFLLFTGDLVHSDYERNFDDWISQTIKIDRPIQSKLQREMYFNATLCTRGVKKRGNLRFFYCDDKLNENRPNVIDVWGNHDWFNRRALDDSFDVPQHTHVAEFCATYPLFAFEYSYLQNRYFFIHVDATTMHQPLSPGPPWNFVGLFSRERMDFLERLLRKANRNKQYDKIILFGHYPLSIISFERTSSGKSFDELERIYPFDYMLSGHLHNLYGAIDDLKAMRNGHFELQLGDFKVHRLYRVVVADGTHFSFVDVNITQQTVILPVSPADCRYSLPVDQQRQSGLGGGSENFTVKFLVYSFRPIVSVQVFVDGDIMGEAIISPSASSTIENRHYFQIQVPFAVLLSDEGRGDVHNVNISIRNSENTTVSHEYPFSFYSTCNGNVISRILLSSNWDLIFRVCFIINYSVVTFLFLFPGQYLAKFFRVFPCFSGFLLLSTKKRRVLVAFGIYQLFGPWILAELMDGEYGLIFGLFGIMPLRLGNNNSTWKFMKTFDTLFSILLFYSVFNYSLSVFVLQFLRFAKHWVEKRVNIRCISIGERFVVFLAEFIFVLNFIVQVNLMANYYWKIVRKYSLVSAVCSIYTVFNFVMVVFYVDVLKDFHNALKRNEKKVKSK